MSRHLAVPEKPKMQWALLGGGLALSLVTMTATAPSASAAEAGAPTEVEIALPDTGLSDNNVPVATTPVLSVGKIGELQFSTVSFERVISVLQQASTNADGQQFGSQVSTTALQLALLLTHYIPEHATPLINIEAARAHSEGRQFIPDAPTLRPNKVRPDGGASAKVEGIVLVTPAPLAEVIEPEPTTEPEPIVEPEPTTESAENREQTEPSDEVTDEQTISNEPTGSDESDDNAEITAPDESELFEGELTEALTSLEVNGREISLDSVTWDDVAYTAMYLARIMSPDSLDAAGVTVIVPDLVVELEGENLAFGSPADLINGLIARYSLSTEGYANGNLPAEILCSIPFAPSAQLRCDAAGAIVALNEAFKAEFGYNLPIGSSYRPYEAQVQLALVKPHLAATPGTSNHGWGLAIDFGGNIYSGQSAEYYWMLQNAPIYGWDNPAWARLNGTKPEPWHFEFVAGKSPNPGGYRYTINYPIFPTEPEYTEQVITEEIDSELLAEQWDEIAADGVTGEESGLPDGDGDQGTAGELPPATEATTEPTTEPAPEPAPETPTE